MSERETKFSAIWSEKYAWISKGKHCMHSARCTLCSKLFNIRNRGCNWTQTQNHLTRKQTLNHLVKLAKWLSCVLSTYLYGALNCMFLSCHIRVFRVNPHPIVAWMLRNSLLELGMVVFWMWINTPKLKSTLKMRNRWDHSVRIKPVLVL